MTNLKRISFLVLIIMFFSTSVSVGQESFPLIFRKDRDEINYLYNIQLKKIEEESEFFEAHINYPYFQIKEKYKDKEKENMKSINKINNEIYNYIANFKGNIEKQSEEYKKDYEISNKHSSLPKFVYEAYSQYNVTYNENNLVSIPILTYEFTGGAHGMSVLKSFNYNLKSGEELKLSNIFKDNVDYKNIINTYIKKEIKKNKDLYFTGKEGFKGIDDNQGFYLKNDKLIIYFQLYEIAPYYVGIPKFEIPLDEIEGKLNTSYF
ncbi:DUF3298 and DUF4163 domain-containing protein [Terrisporobacter mayombei]|uniref:Peptidoglycan-N-acetylmuramic acid deacetylase PdaC n=1 Tax=Terrisporobacter mayombei TaxID=1541 RepID=A0ABY9Q3K0_9FIRM|nr:DUF3298 and DUF4163 domain-containing protein [Terrisporobacter mayombei]MCC3867485.1 DUF3298 and DUF4163 domain-containing protein [Terrisporobacter mayombei]WMT81746.1 Peptidoglycan-N-acetylmuramic acid deacetylase PdaC [Terrisporobacter mayombei]